jgi:hypothetical protein
VLRLQWAALCHSVKPTNNWREVDFEGFGSTRYVVADVPIDGVLVQLAFSMIGDAVDYAQRGNVITGTLTRPTGDADEAFKSPLIPRKFNEARIPTMGLPFISCATGVVEFREEGLHTLVLALAGDERQVDFEVVRDASLRSDGYFLETPRPSFRWLRSPVTD